MNVGVELSLHKRGVLISSIALLAILLVVYVFNDGTPLSLFNVIHDEDWDFDIQKSQNIELDKQRMWRLVDLKTKGQHGDVTYKVSPVSAINAASRVIESEKEVLIGLSINEVLSKLGHVEEHRQGSYNFPFYPLAERQKAMVLRFDCGSFGWQFNLMLDDDDKIKEIQRLGIE